MLEFMLKRREDFIVNKATRFSVAGELENLYASGDDITGYRLVEKYLRNGPMFVVLA
ncbi:EamA family transporter RarD, partial [Salmonella enterica]|nr:EamA family transporter RarD [Salmonella enterica]EAU3727851.1 EamA family transporter RarD [Salmonella enterica]EBO7884570.1 EamA family transporter RarD [Salmonella enterica]